MTGFSSLHWPDSQHLLIQPRVTRKKKKKRTSDLGCQTPFHLPGTPIHVSVPSLQVLRHKLAVKVDQGKTTCECFVLWYNHRPCLLPWRVFWTRIMAVTIVKIPVDCWIQTKSLLTLSVFNYPLTTRDKPPNYPVVRGKRRDFNNSVPCQVWWVFSFTYQIVSA